MRKLIGACKELKVKTENTNNTKNRGKMIYMHKRMKLAKAIAKTRSRMAKMKCSRMITSTLTRNRLELV